jgi:hypothetical protein
MLTISQAYSWSLEAWITGLAAILAFATSEINITSLTVHSFKYNANKLASDFLGLKLPYV